VPAARSPSRAVPESIDDPSHDSIGTVTLALVCLTARLIGLCAGAFVIRNREVVSEKFSVAAGVVIALLSVVPVLVGVVFLTWDTTS